LLRTQVELENQIARGLKLDLATALNPAKSQKSAILSAIYKQPSLHAKTTVDILKGPTFTTDAVIGRDGFLVGGEASYDVQSGAVTRYAAALGFSAPEYAVTLHGLGNLSTFAASYYHKVSKDVDVGAKAVYDTKSTTGGVSLEVGAKTYLVSDCCREPLLEGQTADTLGQRFLRQGQVQQRWCPLPRLHPGSPTRCQG
jgi:voltage-dependent anion channel protein 2